MASLIAFGACDQQVSGNDAPLPMINIVDTAAPKVLVAGEKMDTAHFWKIMDYAFEKAGFHPKLKEQAILDQLTRLTPEQIVDFEIIFQQMNLKACTWNNLAAQTLIDGGMGDDGSYYMMVCMMLGSKN